MPIEETMTQTEVSVLLDQIDTMLEDGKIIGVGGGNGDGEVHVWYGGHGVNVYVNCNGELVETDYYNVGDFAENSAKPEEVRDTMKNNKLLKVHDIS